MKGQTSGPPPVVLFDEPFAYSAGDLTGDGPWLATFIPSHIVQAASNVKAPANDAGMNYCGVPGWDQGGDWEVSTTITVPASVPIGGDFYFHVAEGPDLADLSDFMGVVADSGGPTTCQIVLNFNVTIITLTFGTTHVLTLRKIGGTVTALLDGIAIDSQPSIAHTVADPELRISINNYFGTVLRLNHLTVTQLPS